MSPKLLYNCHGGWSCQGIDSADGRVFHAVGFAEKRDCDGVASPGFSVVDCDPATWNLGYETCSDACNKIATHAFIPINTPSFADWDGASKDWLPQAVAPVVAAAWPPSLPSAFADLTGFLGGCLEWQSRLQPSAYILPTPPLTGPNPDMTDFVKWVRSAIRAGTNFGRPEPLLLALTVEDTLLLGLVDVLLDQVTARDGIDGVYLNLVTAGTTLSERLGEETAGAIYRFVGDLSRHRSVYVNTADIFGLAAIGAGAEGIGIGYEQKGTRLNLADFKNSDSRGAFPKMLSLAFCKRLAIDEVEAIRDAGLLDRLEYDRTDASSSLLNAVAAGQDIRTLDPWRPERGRVAAARRHFILSHSNAVASLNALPVTERKAWVRDWLATANTNVNDYCAAIGQQPQQVGLGHVHEWLRAVV